MNEGPHNANTIKSLQDQVGILLEQENINWKQRVKMNWYQLVDKNTKYFHICASQKRKKNYMKQVKDLKRKDND